MIELLLYALTCAAIAYVVSYINTRSTLEKFNVAELNNALIDSHRILADLKKHYKRNAKRREANNKKSFKIKGKKVEVYKNPHYVEDQKEINPEVQ